MTKMLDMDIPEKRRRGQTNLTCQDACKRDMRGGAERGQHNKQGSMGEEDTQLDRRPQYSWLTDEEEELKTSRRIQSNGHSQPSSQRSASPHPPVARGDEGSTTRS